MKSTIHRRKEKGQREGERERERTYVCPGTSEVYDLGTPVAVLLQSRALKAVEGVGDALAAAHDTLILVVAETALVADAHQRRWPHIGIAHWAFAVAFIAQASDRDAGLLAAHNQISEGGGVC